MICGKCGHDNPAHVLFCMQCGTEVSHAPTTMRTEMQRENVSEGNARLQKKLLKWTTLAALVAIAAFGIRLYARGTATFSHSVFFAAPRVQVDRVPQLELPALQPPIPGLRPATSPIGLDEETVLQQMKDMRDQ